MEPKVLIVIPAYNEADNILNTVSGVVEHGFDYVVVNDGSRDTTLDVCRSNGLNVLDLPMNLGIGGAVQAGHKYAQRFGYDIDIQLDGDGQHDPAYLDALVHEVVSGADLVIGSRFLEKTDGFQSTFMRRVGITWLSAILKLCTGRHVSDPTSGFRACGRRAIDLFCASYPVDYPEPESIAVAIKSGLSVKEVSVEMRERQGGTSSIGGLSSVYYMIKVSLAILIASVSRRTK
ncbi:Polyprenol monophosphomannose synthase [Collinsella intestinalis]|uniref:Polyprenol monophosphomannose synthase n=1 Tax=Collinsella intestinalis TaxID=147207 RepID=A0A5K1IRN3_9ACTN|nr:glycosyltransferase family 2 protein [Collinsella intestinalis]VWL91011.1 Polyprenol monophosphomannose synthase [Collinsella intestinalis]